MEHSFPVSGQPRCVLSFWHGSSGSLSAFWISQTILFLIPSFWVQSSLAIHGSHVGNQSPPWDLDPVDIAGIQRVELLPLRLTHCRAISVSFLSGTFSPSCLRRTNCLGEAFFMEGCDLSGTFPRELKEQAWPVSLSLLPLPLACSRTWKLDSLAATAPRENPLPGTVACLFCPYQKPGL